MDFLRLLVAGPGREHKITIPEQDRQNRSTTPELVAKRLVMTGSKQPETLIDLTSGQKVIATHSIPLETLNDIRVSNQQDDRKGSEVLL